MGGKKKEERCKCKEGIKWFKSPEDRKGRCSLGRVPSMIEALLAGVHRAGGVARHQQSKWFIDKTRRQSNDTRPSCSALHLQCRFATARGDARASQDFLSNCTLLPRASTPRGKLYLHCLHCQHPTYLGNSFAYKKGASSLETAAVA